MTIAAHELALFIINEDSERLRVGRVEHRGGCND